MSRAFTKIAGVALVVGVATSALADPPAPPAKPVATASQVPAERAKRVDAARKVLAAAILEKKKTKPRRSFEEELAATEKDPATRAQRLAEREAALRAKLAERDRRRARVTSEQAAELKKKRDEADELQRKKAAVPAPGGG